MLLLPPPLSTSSVEAKTSHTKPTAVLTADVFQATAPTTPQNRAGSVITFADEAVKGFARTEANLLEQATRMDAINTVRLIDLIENLGSTDKESAKSALITTQNLVSTFRGLRMPEGNLPEALSLPEAQFWLSLDQTLFPVAANPTDRNIDKNKQLGKNFLTLVKGDKLLSFSSSVIWTAQEREEARRAGNLVLEAQKALELHALKEASSRGHLFETENHPYSRQFIRIFEPAILEKIEKEPKQGTPFVEEGWWDNLEL
ncbi:MAG: hypothetical protein NTW61_09750 [Candidatus Melainabacteria bacterium]|nr:hypothetical protein [Candidatus Melainabacteria bacterium]